MEKFRLISLLKNLLLIFQISICTVTIGQETANVDPEIKGTIQNRAPVIVDGKTLFTVMGISSYPAELRVTNIAQRIETAAANPSVSTDSVKIIETEDKLSIFAGEVFIMYLFPEDGVSEGINSNALAEIFQARIIKADIAGCDKKTDSLASR